MTSEEIKEKLEKFKEYRLERGNKEEHADMAVELCREFLEFVGKKPEDVQYEDMHRFSAVLVESQRDNFDNYVFLVWLAYWVNNEPFILAAMELIDGGEMPRNLSKLLSEHHGQEIHDKVFEGIGMPSMGMHPMEKSRVMKIFVDRMVELIGRQETEKLMNIGMRDKYTQSYENARKLYEESGDIDAYLGVKRKNFIKLMEKHRDEQTLFFTQKVDERVVQHVKDDKFVEGGVRSGTILEVNKIPYLTQEWMDARTEKESIYYFCHNPWVREGIMDDNIDIDPVICHNSAAFYKNFWEGVLGEEVRVELKESVLLGGKVCKFHIHLPQSVVPEQ